MDFSKAKKQAYNGRTKTFIVRDENGIIGHSKTKIDGIPCTNDPETSTPQKLPKDTPKFNPDTNSDEPEKTEDQADNEEHKTPDPEATKKNPWGLYWW